MSLRTAVLAVVLALAFPAAAGAQDAALTPEGPATLHSVYEGGSRMSDPLSYVLVAWRVTVGAGGRPGTVRPRFVSPSTGFIVGEPVELPAEPGVYLFPAPHLPYGSLIGLDQFTGGHAIARRDSCTSAYGRQESCEQWSVRAYRGDPPPGPGTTADVRIAHAQLAVDEIHERDDDGDGVADQSTDRTDLALSLSKSVDVHGNIRVAFTVTNHGPRTADLPGLGVVFPAYTDARWDDDCTLNFHMAIERMTWGSACSLPAIAPGASHTLWLTLPYGTGPTPVRVFAEGPDLQPADNATTLTAPMLAPMTLDVPARQRLSKGIKVTLLAARPGRVDVRAVVFPHGRALMVSRRVTLAAATPLTVTLHPRGAQLRSLRRAVKRGPLRGFVVTGNGDTVQGPSVPLRLLR